MIAQIRGRTVYQLSGEPFSAWFEGNDLIAVAGDCDEDPEPGLKAQMPTIHQQYVSDILEAADGKQPNVTTHPGFVLAVAEGKDLKGFEADGLFFIGPDDDRGLFRWVVGLDVQDSGATTGHPSQAEDDPAKTARDNAAHERIAGTNEEGKHFLEQVEALGFNRLKRVVGRWGFQDGALLADVRIERLRLGRGSSPASIPRPFGPIDCRRCPRAPQRLSLARSTSMERITSR